MQENGEGDDIMYVIASLPMQYGQFNRIKEDNYPFQSAFTSYLEAFCSLGLALSMDAAALTGYIEESLFAGRRLPDIVPGNAPVKFRFPVSNATVERYFKEAAKMKNKTAVLHVVRMTLRLSAEYGTSLARLTHLLRSLAAESQGGCVQEGAVVDKSVENVERPNDARKKHPQSVDNHVDNHADGEEGPVQQPAEPATDAPAGKDGLGQQTPAEPAKEQVLEKLNALVQKAGELSGTPAAGPGSGAPVVETNPLLSDFF